MSDEEILEAAARVIGRVGPLRLTLSEVGSEVGLAAATLVQRFGSKRDLLLALAGAGPGAAAEFPTHSSTARGSAVDALIEIMACMGEMARTPEEMSNHLAFLQMDLSDADFHVLTAGHFRATLDSIGARLDDAVTRGELAPVDSAVLARAVQSMANGALLNWAIHREGTAVEAIRVDLRALLEPYRRPAKQDETGKRVAAPRRAG